MKNIPTGDKLLWAENLRVIATVSVIFLHVSAITVMQYGKVSNLEWWAANVYDSSVRFCVPIFVMLTGALILPKDYELGAFLKNRLIRIVLPFIFWSFVYIVYKLCLEALWGEKPSLLGLLNEALVLIQHGVSFHFWYIYMILEIYLFVPVIGKWVRNCNEKEIIYFLLIWLFTLVFFKPGVLDFVPKIDLKYFTGYLGYLVLGYYLAFKQFKSPSAVKLVSKLLVVIGVVITIVGTFLISFYNARFVDVFYLYLSPNVLLASVGVFLFFVNGNKNLNSKRITIIRDVINRFSFGIYLIHVLVLDLLDIFGINNNLISPVLGIPLITIFCLMLSVGIIFIVNKLPYGKYISG